MPKLTSSRQFIAKPTVSCRGILFASPDFVQSTPQKSKGQTEVRLKPTVQIFTSKTKIRLCRPVACWLLPSFSQQCVEPNTTLKNVGSIKVLQLTKAVRRVKLPAIKTVSGVQYLSGEPLSKHLRLRCLQRGATRKIERLKMCVGSSHRKKSQLNSAIF